MESGLQCLDAYDVPQRRLCASTSADNLAGTAVRIGGISLEVGGPAFILGLVSQKAHLDYARRFSGSLAATSTHAACLWIIKLLSCKWG